MELTGFDIDYTDRIVLPITSTSDMLTNPIYDDFVTHDPTVEQQTKVITSTEFANQTGSPYDPGNVVAIIDNRFVNAARQRIKGIDVTGSYRFDLANSRQIGSASCRESECQCVEIWVVAV